MQVVWPSTEGFSEFGCHTQVVGAEHTFYTDSTCLLVDELDLK